MISVCNPLGSRAKMLMFLIVTPIDDVEKLPCMTNDRSNTAQSTLIPQASYPSTFYTTFSIAPYWNGGSLPNAPQSIGTIKINPFTYRAKEGKAISTALRLRGRNAPPTPAALPVNSESNLYYSYAVGR